jgi:hypothetical protein
MNTLKVKTLQEGDIERVRCVRNVSRHNRQAWEHGNTVCRLLLVATCALNAQAVCGQTPPPESALPLLAATPSLRRPVSILPGYFLTSKTANAATNGLDNSVGIPFSLMDDDAEQLLPLNDPPETDVIAVGAEPAQAKPTPAKPGITIPGPLLRPGVITIDSFGNADSVNGIFQFPDGVHLTYTEEGSKATTTLTAQSAEYDPKTGLLTAHKSARLERTEGSFVADEITYNLVTQAGFVTNGIAESDYFRMRGDRIEALPDGSYQIENGVYTTCIRGRPDYQIRARRLRIKPNQYVTARHVTFYAGPTALITLPTLTRSLTRSSNAPIPTPGYNTTDGFFLNLRDTPIVEPRRSLGFDLQLNFRHLPTGFAAYEFDLKPPAPRAPSPRTLRTSLSDPLRGYLEQLTPPTYREYAADRYEDEFAPRTTAGIVLQNDQFVYNRRRTDLRVSRFPEVSAHFINVLGRSRDANALQNAQDNAADANGDPAGPAGAVINPILQRTSSAPFLLDVSLNAGGISEYPTQVTAGRFSIQTTASTQPLLVGRRISLRFAVSDWINTYTSGSWYHLFSPETELDYLPTRTTRLGMGYRFSNDTGRTPFAFDRLDVRQELRLLFQTGGPVGFGVETKFDLERSRAYDTEVAVVRNFDCMQVGFAYALRGQQFNIIFHLFPPTRDRATRRTTPLQSIPGRNSGG